ncbi:hypothetical protein MBRA1_002693 [Malassezia brasiliensis]|uniref:F-box domain-containing protein n=1 Tax=Malassezia brasiliensis TaxID=1821822 RepID=A0AAF0DVE3_9BASI|nr:hypothetical protein MBRA1_002693 [Malassezia brasiliensis]
MDDVARLSAALVAPLPGARRAALLLERAEVHAARGDDRAALRDLRDALRAAPRHAEVRRTLTQSLLGAARVFLQLRMREKAVRVLRAAAQCAPDDVLRRRIAHLQRDAAHGAPPAASGAARLPAEVLLGIARHLDTASLGALASVCRTWRRWVCAHAPLWHTVHVGRLGAASGPSKARAQRQAALLRVYMRRGKHHVRDMTLVPPLADADAAAVLRAAPPLTALTVHCAPAHAGAWVAHALRIPTLQHLAVHAPGGAQHAWLARPLCMDGAQCAPLRSLALHGTPPLQADAATLRVCSALEALAYSAPACAAPLRQVRERWAPAAQCIVHGAQGTLHTLALDGDAVWAIDAFLDAPRVPQAGIARFPALHTLHAPLKCMVLHGLPDVALSTLLPQLHTLTLQVSLPRTPGGTSAALLQFATAVGATVRRVRLRITRDSSAWLVAALLRAWPHVAALEVVWDETAAAEAPALSTAHDTLQRPLTGAVLVQLLTPGVLDERVLCPALTHLTIGADATLRGRELAELVVVRKMLAARCSVAAARAAVRQRRAAADPDLEAPAAAALVALDVEACRELQPEAVAYVRQHCDVVWCAAAAERARHAAARAPRTLGERMRFPS